MRASMTTANPPKRSRAAVACRRCKSRKQKCDGKPPGHCSNCTNSGSTCEYEISPLPAHVREQYLRAVQRVQELEDIAYQAGLLDQPSTGWPDPNCLAAGGAIPVPSKRPRDDPQDGHVEHDQDNHAGSPHSVDSFVDVMRDLSIEAAGGYVNSTANVSMSRIFDTLLKTQESTVLKSGQLFDGLLSPKSAEDLPLTTAIPPHLSFDGIPDNVAERMLYGYLRHIYTLWPIFPISFVRDLHTNRESLKHEFEVAALHLVYGAGGRYLETTGETGIFKSEGHYAAAASLLEHVLQLHDIRSVQILLLFAIYGLRAPRGPGAWSVTGLAMRICVELGLHRRRRSGSETSPFENLRRCVFWSCYSLDRQISIILGRPFAISDRDIDVELPTGFENSSDRTADGGSTEPAAMECFIHIFRLRIIESHIHQTIYRVDKPGVSEADLEDCLQRLETWKNDIPADALLNKSASINRSDYYMVYYYKSLRYLLHPHVSSPHPRLRYLQKCVEACGGICQTYKKLHESVTVGFSLMALHSVFFAGLALLYCSWARPKEIYNIKTSTDMSACSIVLYIIAERWPGAKKYRDTFEALKQSVLESIDDGDYEPRRAIKKLKPDMSEALKTMHPTEACQEDLVSMVAAMVERDAPPSDNSRQEAADLTGSGVNPVRFAGVTTNNNTTTTTASHDDNMISWVDMPLNDDWLADMGSVSGIMDAEQFSWLL